MPRLKTTHLPPPEKLIGTILDGRYFVEKELGHGGIGAIYLARDRKLVDKQVVIKVLLEKTLQNEWAVGKFKHEKEALARVDHPGIIGILDTGELTDGKPYIVMQYVDGVTLRSIMRAEGMDLDRAARLIEQIGEALGAAHEDGIIHRDLKPENIMIQPLAGGREQAKVIDFGIAKVRDSQVAPSTVVQATAGTIAYMSPEQLRAEKVTVASDIYALGVIGYEMVTGRRPFNPETGYQLLEMQREGVRVRPKDLRPALSDATQAVILKAIAFEPQDRYQSAVAFGEDFARAITTGVETPRGFVEREAQPTEPGEPKRKAQPELMALAAILLIGVIASVAWLALRSRNSETPQQANSSTSVPASERTLNYWLTVQKMRDGKPYQEPFESSGQEIFENGWKFRFHAASPQSGHLYLLNEGPDATGKTTYNLLYPTPASNNGSAQLAVNQQMQTGWYVFDEHQGTERFWIVWSKEPVAELEAVKGVVNPQDRGTIKDRKQADALREFLTKNNASKPEAAKDSAKKQTNVKGKGDSLVNLVELEHH
jgi:serine/threonine-protein kinase